MNKFDFKLFINGICDFMTIRANEKEKRNKDGFCDHEVVGFVHGVRWCVSCIKSNLNYLERTMDMNNFENIVEFFNEIMDVLEDDYKNEYNRDVKNGILASRVAIYELFRKKYECKGSGKNEDK